MSRGDVNFQMYQCVRDSEASIAQGKSRWLQVETQRAPGVVVQTRWCVIGADCRVVVGGRVGVEEEA